MEDVILSVECLTKTYGSDGSGLTVLRDVSFSIESGSSCAVVGPSGSGKTTLLGLCAGLDRPSSGRVFLAGAQLNELTEEQLSEHRNQNLGFVFQTFQLIPTLTALENVMVPRELQGLKESRAAGLKWLDRVGLSDRVQHYPIQLSGGEQQRVALARAFINRPKILFADEPTGNLDEDTSQVIQELLFRLNRESQTTLIVVTHDSELAALADRVLHMRGGRLVGEPGDQPAFEKFQSGTG